MSNGNPVHSTSSVDKRWSDDGFLRGWRIDVIESQQCALLSTFMAASLSSAGTATLKGGSIRRSWRNGEHPSSRDYSDLGQPRFLTVPLPDLVNTCCARCRIARTLRHLRPDRNHLQAVWLRWAICKSEGHGRLDRTSSTSLQRVIMMLG